MTIPSNEEQYFLNAIRENTADTLLWKGYADWLEEQHDRPDDAKKIRQQLQQITSTPTGNLAAYIAEFNSLPFEIRREYLDGKAALIEVKKGRIKVPVLVVRGEGANMQEEDNLPSSKEIFVLPPGLDQAHNLKLASTILRLLPETGREIKDNNIKRPEYGFSNGIVENCRNMGVSYQIGNITPAVEAALNENVLSAKKALLMLSKVRSAELSTDVLELKKEPTDFIKRLMAESSDGIPPQGRG